jgi:hypothetical protein
VRVLEPETRASVDGLLLRAATVGGFDARALVGVVSRPEDRRILVALAERCEEVRTEAGVRWMLNPDTRRTVLKAAGVERARAAARQIQPSDRFGRFLQEVLFDRPVNAGDLDTAALDELFTARQFVEQAGFGAERRSPEVNRAIARRESDAALRVVLPTPLVGRQRELATLRRFVKTGTVDGVEPSPQAWPEGSPPILAVTGVGGSGKSALLATLMEELRDAAAGPMWPVVILDFDLPALSSADPLEMLFTLTRQLGHTRPELDDALSAFRVECRRTLGLEESSSGGYDSRAHQQSVALSALGPIIQKSDLASTPVVLVLDTFEEILVRGEVETRFVFKWLDAVRREGQFRELRVILAGRASSAEVVPELASRVLDTLVLGDLDEEGAFEMLYADLRRSGRSGAPVEKLVRTFGGNPLVLRILAQFARANDRDELYALVEGAHTASTEKVTGELAQRFLYERILERIRDEEMKKLASLGLVLRRVTPELLREVLAGPCGFEHPESTDWDALFAKLRMQVWLVENEGERVRHRRDLRRLVLPQILSANRERALGIHRAAVEYYSRDHTPHFAASEREAERLYHQYSLQDHPPIDPSNAGSLWLALGMDVEELPAATRALLKHHTGRLCTLQERATLPPRLQEAQRVLERRMYRSRGAEAVIVDLDRELDDRARYGPGSQGAELESRSLDDPEDFPDLELLDSYLHTGHFDIVTDHAPAAYQGYLGQEWPRDKWAQAEQVVWSVFLAGLVEQADAPVVGDLCETARRRYLRPGPVRDAEEGRRFTAALLLGIGATWPSRRCRDVAGEMLRRERVGSVHTATTFIHLREASMIHAAGFGGVIPELEISGQLLPVLAPGFLPDPEREDSPRWRAVQEDLERAGQFRPPATDWARWRREPPTLGTVESLTAEYARVRIRLDARKVRARETLPWILRGTTPELHALLRNALVQLVEREVALEELGDRLRGHTALWPRELLGSELTTNLRHDAPRWCATLLGCADRTALLPVVTGFIADQPVSGFYKASRLFDRYEQLLLAWPGTDHDDLTPSPWSAP